MAAEMIEDYAIVGDCRTVCLISRDASVDWLCLPRFDGSACFAALLGTEAHGAWKIAPMESVTKKTRAYRGDTLVLDTFFETPDGRVTVTDWMLIGTEHPVLMRMAHCTHGRVRMRSSLNARFEYGSVEPWMEHLANGVMLVAGPDMMELYTEAPTAIENHRAITEFELDEGERCSFILNWHPAHLEASLPLAALPALERTLTWWRRWSATYKGNGEYREAIMRSLITLKALSYEPTGGIVAAPTTSLPEELGGTRNWDYRFCWLRDSAYTLIALARCGFVKEATAWRQWVARATAGAPHRMQIMYGLSGERSLREWVVDWLPGFHGSVPVRIGNAAFNQFQLDVYGELIASLAAARRSGIETSQRSIRMAVDYMEVLSKLWREPDEGIWEVRGPRRHFVHSKLMAWLAFDLAIKVAQREHLDVPVDFWKAERRSIQDEICAKGFDKNLGSFVQFYGGKSLDAGLLEMAFLGFLPPDDPRLLGTIAAIERHLVKDGFVSRYSTETQVDGLPGTEGAFILCTYWLADAYLAVGRRADAKRVFERILAIRNDVGLLAEEYDPKARRMLGNFPQAFSHVGLINTGAWLENPDQPLLAD